MSRVSSSLLIALTVIALLWGNCLSCPQMIAATASHSCCPKDKAPTVKCDSAGLKHFVKAEMQAPAAPAVAGLTAAPATVGLAVPLVLVAVPSGFSFSSPPLRV